MSFRGVYLTLCHIPHNRSISGAGVGDMTEEPCAVWSEAENEVCLY